MVAEGDDIRPAGEEFLVNVLADAETMGGVLTVHHHKVGLVALAQHGQFAGNRIAP